MRLLAQGLKLPTYQDVESSKGWTLGQFRLPNEINFGEATVGDVISALIPYIFMIAGLVFFVFLIWSGFEFLMSAGDPEKVKSAQGKLVNAIIGFVVIFVAYWLVQILGVIFGLQLF